MFTLTDELENEIEISGKFYALNLFFDTVILLFELFNDDNFDDAEKIEIAFDMLVMHHDGSKVDTSFNNKFDALQAIMDTYILEEKDDDKNSGGNNEKLYDLKQDAGYIYASFLQEYGIDLIEQQGKLRWEKFNALLSGLRDNTKFKDIVGIRGAKLPTGKENKDERDRLRKLQKIYALKKDQKTKELELNAMFNALSNGR